MKDFLRRKFLNSHRRHQTHCQQKLDEQQHHHQSPTKNKRVVLSSDCGGDGDEEEGYYNSTEEDIYVEFPNYLKMINNNLSYEKNSNNSHCFDNLRDSNSHHRNHQQQHHQLQRTGGAEDRDSNEFIRNRSQNSTPTSSFKRRHRPLRLFSSSNINCNDNEKIVHSPSSEDDNSPTEMNNCRRLADKPPLVKRLTMGFLSKSTLNEDTHNHNHQPSSTPRPHAKNNTIQSLKSCSNSRSTTSLSNGYVNEMSIYEPEKYIASKFGDSCRQSLTSIPMLDNLNLNDNMEFNLKKKYLRETSSANSSPRIFGGRAGRFRANSLSRKEAAEEVDDSDLKDAPWFQAGISRQIALEVLQSESAGSFLVRKSNSKPGCYALSLRLQSPPGPKVAHYIIVRTSTKGFKIKGFRKEFNTLSALITHHSVMPELLPLPLSLPRPASSSRRNLDDFDSYDSLKLMGIMNYLESKNVENE
ncbi:hypothetical protein ACFFRR_010433 [Megaselia abdita]